MPANRNDRGSNQRDDSPKIKHTRSMLGAPLDAPKLEEAGLPTMDPQLQGGLEAPIDLEAAPPRDRPERTEPTKTSPRATPPMPSTEGLPMVDAGGISAIDAAALTPLAQEPPLAGEAESPAARASSEAEAKPKIRALGMRKRHEDAWARTPNATGSGAIHVKTFHCKLTDDSLHAMDQRINEWLDDHPQYEVKFVNSSIGQIHGKIKEPHLICQVWV